MKFKQVYKRCEEKGIKITKEGLYKAGLHNGFIVRNPEKHSNTFIQKEFEKWIEKKLEVAPEGYVSFAECSEKLNIPLATIYYLIREGNLKTIQVGTKKVKYVRLREIEKHIEIRERGSEEKYGN